MDGVINCLDGSLGMSWEAKNVNLATAFLLEGRKKGMRTKRIDLMAALRYDLFLVPV